MNNTSIFATALLFTAITATAQKKIDQAALPKAANEFLAQNFKGNAITTVKKEVEHGEKGFEVRLADGTEIEFWNDGKYREVDGHNKPIPTQYIDPKIMEYIAKHYPDKKITHIDYGRKDVDVELSGNLELEFDSKGNFLKID